MEETNGRDENKGRINCSGRSQGGCKRNWTVGENAGVRVSSATPVVVLSNPSSIRFVYKERLQRACLLMPLRDRHVHRLGNATSRSVDCLDALGSESELHGLVVK